MSEQTYKGQLTKRARDSWDCARFGSLALSFGDFRFLAYFSPTAGNLSHWEDAIGGVQP